MAKKTTTGGKVAPKADAADKLKDFMVDGMKDLYWAEKALVKNLPKMHKNATSKNLKAAIAGHLEETKGQVQRLEDAFKALGERGLGILVRARQRKTAASGRLCPPEELLLFLNAWPGKNDTEYTPPTRHGLSGAAL